MKRKISILFIAMLIIGLFTGCSNTKTDIKDIKTESSMELKYAEKFSVDYLEGGYKLITINENDKFLLVPKDKETPKVPKGVAILKQPIDNIYLVAASAMSFFDEMNVLDVIKLTGTKEEAWYIENARKAMKNKEILFAGKYSEPDYELILSNKTQLSIQSTMINHMPEVKEKLIDLSIPVLTEYSSYETHPLGRTEWIKLYGALLDKEDIATEIFEKQNAVVEQLSQKDKDEKTIAYFHISSSGYAVARKSGDYITKMIELAGGEYVFKNLGDPEKATSTVNLEMEEFYATAKEADIVIYNNTIANEVTSMEEFLALNELLKDFKAVKNNNVYATGKNLYQETTKIAAMVEDINTILNQEQKEMQFIKKLK